MYVGGGLYEELNPNGSVACHYTPGIGKKGEKGGKRGRIPFFVSNQTKFYYDDNQNRVKMTTKAGGIYHFVYDPTASIPAVVYEEGGNRRFVNIREPGGSLVSREFYSSIGNLINQRTYHFDGLGSTVALSDEDGEITDRYTYDAWGNVTSEWGSTSYNPYRFVGQLGYYTHYQEPDFDLLQLGVRYYDPETGRFTQSDPLADDTKKYLYAADAPTILVDPDGRKEQTGGETFCDAKTGKMLTRYRTGLSPCELNYIEHHEKVHRGDIGPCCKLYAKCYKKYNKKWCNLNWRKYGRASTDWTEYRAYSASLAYIKKKLKDKSHTWCCKKFLEDQLITVRIMLKQHKAGKDAKDPCSRFFAKDGKPK